MSNIGAIATFILIVLKLLGKTKLSWKMTFLPLGLGIGIDIILALMFFGGLTLSLGVL